VHRAAARHDADLSTGAARAAANRDSYSAAATIGGGSSTHPDLAGVAAAARA